MTRTVSSVPLEGSVRHHVKIEGDPCMAMARLGAYEMLQHLATVPDLLMCGDQPFERLTMHFNGTCWIVEAEATVHST